MKKKQETLLPERKARAQPWKRIHALPTDEQFEAVKQLNADRAAHPDTLALQRIESHLQAAHLHPDLARSPELIKLLFVFRELVQDFVPGETVEQALEPLRTALARHGGGGRPQEVDHDEVRRYHARLKEAGESAPTSATGTRFGISTRHVRKILGA